MLANSGFSTNSSSVFLFFYLQEMAELPLQG